MSLDLTFQNFNTAQSNLQPGPVTIASTTTITPTTLTTIVTGVTAIATINPPLTGQHVLAIIAAATNFAGFLTTGNILVASITNGITWQNRANFFLYNPLTGKYYPSYSVLTTTAP